MTGYLQDPQAKSAFLQFAQRDSFFCPEISTARAIVGFFEVRGRIHRGIYQLYRKLTRDSATALEFLRNENHVGREQHRPLANVVGFGGFSL
jgi:hypothetical protein